MFNLIHGLKLIVLVATSTVLFPAVAQLKIFVETPAIAESEPGALWISADFSGALKTSIIKFVPGAELVTNRDSANVVLMHTATERSRGESTAKRVFVGRGVAARASAELIDQCGSILWSESAKDTSRFLASMGADFAKPGPAKVSDRIANRLNQAIRKRRIRPCNPQSQ